jgi:hypothetical protein
MTIGAGISTTSAQRAHKAVWGAARTATVARTLEQVGEPGKASPAAHRCHNRIHRWTPVPTMLLLSPPPSWPDNEQVLPFGPQPLSISRFDRLDEPLRM